MTRGSLAILLFVTACGGKIEPEAVKVSSQTSSPEHPSTTGQVDYASRCAGEDVPPTHLECTGLYANLDKKTIAAGVREYRPGVILWSDGASKTRYISLPKGQKIDASDPNEWKFPVGTKVWKEFVVGGKRVETRFFVKKTESYWSHAAYAWNDSESAADLFIGGDVSLPDGGTWHIPVSGECEQCHRGRTDRLLGFEQVGLGLDGATGITLADLVSEKLIDPAPDRTSLSIGDDGTGMAAAPLAWLHMNCGVTCHNDNSGSTAYGAGMLLRLDPTLLDGRPVSGFDSLTTTLGVSVNTPTWHNQVRIVPGDATNSLLVQLIATRADASDPNASQMPPIASRLVDADDAESVIAWINAMPKADAGAGG